MKLQNYAELKYTYNIPGFTGLAAVWNLIGKDIAMLVCYGKEALWSHSPSETTIGIPNGSL
jgi:hypothetical protein